jgi:hypothetical protein
VIDSSSALQADGPAAPAEAPAGPPASPARAGARVEAAIGTLAATVIALAAPLTLVLPAYLRIERGALWGFVLLVAMAGWGGLVERVALGARQADVGLRLAWGAAALIATGGALCLVSAARAPVLVVLVLGGVLVSLVGMVRDRRGSGARAIAWFRAWPTPVLLAFAALAVLGGIQYLAGASGQFLNANDDQAAYMVFMRKILATGTLLDPFSMRRITAYGGQTLMQAFTTVGAAAPKQVSLFDQGISLAIVLALMLGAFADKPSRLNRALVIVPLVFMLTLPNIRLNTASEVSGIVFFFALFRTAVEKRFRERPLGGAALLGLLGAAACSLRHSYFVPVAVFMAVLYLPTAIAAARAVGAERKHLIVAVARAAGLLVLFLLPWAALSWRSSRTFLFPLVGGNYRPEYVGFTTHSTMIKWAHQLWLNICHCHPVTTVPYFLIAGLLIPWRRTRGALPALLWASFIGFFSVVSSLPLATRWDITRYYYGFTVAAVLATIVTALGADWRRRDGRAVKALAMPAMIVLIAAALELKDSQGSGNGNLYSIYDQGMNAISAAAARTSTLDDASEPYRTLQGRIPTGAPMLVMLDDPFLLDFGRNRIDLVDLPGAASPAPGMPLDDDEKLASYLLAHGYRYLAFVRPSASKSLYRRDHWQRQLNDMKTEEIWRQSAPFYLSTFDRFESLARSRAVLFDDAGMVALDLAARGPRAPTN